MRLSTGVSLQNASARTGTKRHLIAILTKNISGQRGPKGEPHSLFILTVCGHADSSGQGMLTLDLKEPY